MINFYIRVVFLCDGQGVSGQLSCTRASLAVFSYHDLDQISVILSVYMLVVSNLMSDIRMLFLVQ